MTDLPRKSNHLMLLNLVFVMLLSGFLCAQVLAQDAEVVQTEIGLDQIAESQPGEAPKAMAEDPNIELSEGVRQMKMINESLKNAIDENKKLIQDNRALDDELKQLRGSSQINTNRITFLTNQRDDIQRRMEEAEKVSREYAEQIEKLKTEMLEKEKEVDARLAAIEQESAAKKQEDEKAMAMVMPRSRDEEQAIKVQQETRVIQEQARETLQKFEQTSQKMVTKVSKIEKENQKLKMDSLRLHYNLANTFFEQGQYGRCAVEYRKVVELSPMDADAHYNLAFVSGEFLRDFETAYKHYQQYLFLRPNAQDASIVKDKMLDAHLNLKTKIESPIEEQVNVERRQSDQIDSSPRRFQK